ncbi:glycosyltransferase family 4 protein [bacterium CG_4_10_14_0_2_um_filter_33_32]|nr:MAG: hypothetical protein AUJ93_02130 [bacterium CG2_30_33_46]PIR67915.1 MAG: glycosyltransferase family 4 protein [bacterium CG10_big_fil_rev_8_21_14_0_10_33_18]PIU76909.1 MAG: glycosyltransferase family 4 protein [bacterium CG06_land_8_20_14_3_00_33_50]PIW81485.1 MAG: glycosyltransferase family 4 protein [bacterium CG_4_8_14_3_um_filter_33_28]PIY85674.1 MAG: glycosyltransferase family 4 protein [bacterium CG_4_10_14_0_8_um_filter_33_57]PIZ85576.1 MAG: glycosyltransferase family 4 protein 
MKIVIVHDFLNSFGGAERVTSEISDIFKDAPIYTLFANSKITDKFFKDKKIITSSLQKKAEALGFRHKYLLPFMPRAVEEFNLYDFDIVISSSSAWGKGVITKPETIHISYCHTPTRFLWVDRGDYIKQQNLGFIKNYFVSKILDKIKIWDRLAADRVDYWIANSLVTQDRIKKYYRKESVIIYPPVDTDKFYISNHKKDFFLIVSRLSPYKNISLAVDVFNELGLELVVIGEGPQKQELIAKAKDNIKILGFKSDEEVIKYYQECRAFVFPTFNEDFGLTPVEAMACGKPVIAAGKGGTRETIVEDKTGIFFEEPTKESLKKAINKFLEDENRYNQNDIREHALKFSKNEFDQRIKDFVKDKYNSLVI